MLVVPSLGLFGLIRKRRSRKSEQDAGTSASSLHTRAGKLFATTKLVHIECDLLDLCVGDTALP